MLAHLRSEIIGRERGREGEGDGRREGGREKEREREGEGETVMYSHTCTNC